MYSDLANQLFYLGRFGFAFLLLFGLWPRVMFRGPEKGLDGYFSRYILMSWMTIALGYLLVAVQLYELISFSAAILAVYLFLCQGTINRKHLLRTIGPGISLRLYDWLDGRYQMIWQPQRWLQWAKGLGLFLRYTLGGWFSDRKALASRVLLAAVLLYSGYLRFYDAMRHAAPPMADAYVTLAWMKYIESKILFHDGIYPHGFHIFLSVLRKLAATDAFYVLKYAGPLNGVLAVLGIYLVVARITGRREPGVIAALVYGLLPNLLHLSLERQASTNSQEFALVFLWPAWYYASSYFKSANRKDLMVAAAAFVIIGWVHSLVFAYLALGVGLMVLAHLLLNWRGALLPARDIVLAGLGAVILAAAPAVLGLLMGKGFHGSSLEYLVASTAVVIPPVTPMDQLALGGLLLYGAVALIRQRRDTGAQAITLFVVLLGVFSLASYLYLGVITDNQVLASRLDLLWGSVAGVAVGLGFAGICQLLPGHRFRRWASLFLCALVVAGVMGYYRPVPVIPYKMQSDSMVEQYLRINKTFRPTEWTIVSAREGYDLALGRGYHINLGDFLSWYDPEAERLARIVNDRSEILTTPNILIFLEKNLYRPPMNEMIPILEQRARDYEAMGEWVMHYRATHENLSIFYEDDDLQVLWVHQPRNQEEDYKLLWGSAPRVF